MKHDDIEFPFRNDQGHVREVGKVAYIRQTQRLVWFKEKKPMAYSISLCLENTYFWEVAFEFRGDFIGQVSAG